jgi:transcription elongation factor Elf1
MENTKVAASGGAAERTFRCPKCTSRDISVSLSFDCKHLELSCRRCKWEWEELASDSPHYQKEK